MASTANGDSAVASGSRAFVTSLRNLPWPPLLVLLIIASPGWFLDTRYRLLPPQVSTAIAVFAIALVLASFVERILHKTRMERVTVFLFAEAGTVANVFLLFGLLWMMAHAENLDGQRLLGSAIFVWICNVLVFSLAYWAMDRGGPEERHSGTSRKPDFIFPEMQGTDDAEKPFEPTFVDYLYLGFSTSMAFSATDTLTASSRARLLIVVQASIALITIAVVAARAVNILPAK